MYMEVGLGKAGRKEEHIEKIGPWSLDYLLITRRFPVWIPPGGMLHFKSQLAPEQQESEDLSVPSEASRKNKGIFGYGGVTSLFVMWKVGIPNRNNLQNVVFRSGNFEGSFSQGFCFCTNQD